MTDRSVSKFRDQVMQVQPSIGTDGDPFTKFYVKEIRGITDMMLNATEEGDLGKFDRLIVHWLDWFGEKSYQHLADSINGGSSHSSSIMRQQAVAAAEHEAFKAIRSWREYGIFEMAKSAVRP